MINQPLALDPGAVPSNPAAKQPSAQVVPGLLDGLGDGAGGDVMGFVMVIQGLGL